MAEMTIRLIVDPATGKKNVIVKLDSDPDALPQEHEQLHRELVEKLIGRGLVSAEELGQITVERPSDEAVEQEEQRRREEPADQRRAQSEG